MVGNAAIITVILPNSNNTILLPIGAIIQQEIAIRIVKTK